MYKQTKGVKMSKVRMNTELRNKLFNRIKDVFEKEDTQEREAFLQAREDVTKIYPVIFAKAKEVVERSYPAEDVQTCRTLKSKYGQPLDVVAKDKCFYFSYASDERQSDSEDEDNHNISEHFDFGLYGKLTDSGYRDTDDEGKNFAYAMNREYLKSMSVIQTLSVNNPRTKTTHIKPNTLRLMIRLWVILVIPVIILMITIQEFQKLLIVNGRWILLELRIVVPELLVVLKTNSKLFRC